VVVLRADCINPLQVRRIIPLPVEAHLDGHADRFGQQGPIQRATRREIMRIMLRAALAALSIGSIPPAIADEGGLNPVTRVPGVIAQAPAQNAPAINMAQRGQAGSIDIQSSRSPWLFPPIGKYLDQQVGG
jgi:hypothetical protein